MSAGVKSAERPAAPVAGGARSRAVGSTVSDREHAFLKAKQRSSRIRFLRKAILLFALASVAAMVLIAIYNPFAKKFGALNFSGVALDGAKIAMARPKLSGFRSDGQPYTLIAERALQDVKRPTLVELQKLSGEIGPTGGELTRLSADAGLYDSVAEHMKLTGNVRIGSARFDVRLRSADIDFKSGVYQSDEPVEVRVGDRTTVNGDRATARHNGQEFVFEGHVRTTILPPPAEAADAKGTSP